MDVTPGTVKSNCWSKRPSCVRNGQEEPTHAGIDMAEDAPLLGQRGDVGDGLDHALAEAARSRPP